MAVVEMKYITTITHTSMWYDMGHIGDCPQTVIDGVPVSVELTCSGCVGEISVSWRKELVGEYIGEGEKQTDWLSQDRTSSEGESCGREQHKVSEAMKTTEKCSLKVPYSECEAFDMFW